MNLWRKLFITNNFPYKFIEIFLWLNNSKEAILDDSQYCLIDSINRNRGKEWPIGIESWLFTVLIFRPPFINGRPQDLVSVFWKKKSQSPCFWGIFPCFFHLLNFFKQESPGVTRGHQRSPGVTRGHQGETGALWSESRINYFGFFALNAS